MAASIPNRGILINTLGLQEAKDSSEIENIVTTHDELFQDDVLPGAFANPAAKEVNRYRQALRLGFDQVLKNGLITRPSRRLKERCSTTSTEFALNSSSTASI